MTPEFIYCYSHCPVWNNFEKEKQRSACFKRKAKVFSPHHLQSRWAATNAKGPYVKPCGWLWALPKPWSLYSLLDLDLQPRLSVPFYIADQRNKIIWNRVTELSTVSWQGMKKGVTIMMIQRQKPYQIASVPQPSLVARVPSCLGNSEVPVNTKSNP